MAVLALLSRSPGRSTRIPCPGFHDSSEPNSLGSDGPLSEKNVPIFRWKGTYGGKPFDLRVILFDDGSPFGVAGTFGDRSVNAVIHETEYAVNARRMHRSTSSRDWGVEGDGSYSWSCRWQ